MSTLSFVLFLGQFVRLLRCPKPPSLRCPRLFLLSALLSFSRDLLLLLACDRCRSALSIRPARGLDCLACSRSLIRRPALCSALLSRFIFGRFRFASRWLLLANSRRCSRLPTLLTSLLDRSLELSLALCPCFRFAFRRPTTLFSNPSSAKLCLPLLRRPQFLFLLGPIRGSGASRSALRFLCLSRLQLCGLCKCRCVGLIRRLRLLARLDRVECLLLSLAMFTPARFISLSRALQS